MKKTKIDKTDKVMINALAVESSKAHILLIIVNIDTAILVNKLQTIVLYVLRKLKSFICHDLSCHNLFPIEFELEIVSAK